MSFACMLFVLSLDFEFKEIHLGDEQCPPLPLIVCTCSHVCERLGTCVSVHKWASVCIFLRFVSPRLCARASVVRWVVLACANVCIRAFVCA